ncbi:DsbA family protein [Bifidobacterium sp.]|jgi:protein-disulfide isomerase|uniref:DsbA family protein n=1 Tax=Bifidobacterium sp. TaxID=41200 RepID=UPI0025BC27F5|nr:thioredoxin domain-containing protein [Bifidobacterium sp.]MCI1634797.1 thioredoxin domain-containing protein [Bifidobacterium sp.]
MSQNVNKRPSQQESNKRSVREQRKAAQLAEQQAKEAKLAKERKQQTLIGIIVVVVVVALVSVAGFAIWRATRPVSTADTEKAYQAVQSVETKPADANAKGGFLISKNGLNKKVANVPTVEEYMDFLCPGCGSFNRSVDPTLQKLVAAGQINLVVYPNAFLDSLSTDEYSTRAASAAAYIAQNDPDHLLDFIADMFAEDFQPSESSYKAVSDKQIQQVAIKAGVSETVAEKSTDGTYKTWISKVSAYSPLRQELWNVSGSNKGQMTTPTVRINSNYWDMNSVSSSGLDTASALIKALGISSSDVGQASVLPSIGASGKPVSLS